MVSNEDNSNHTSEEEDIVALPDDVLGETEPTEGRQTPNNSNDDDEETTAQSEDNVKRQGHRLIIALFDWGRKWPPLEMGIYTSNFTAQTTMYIDF